MEPCKHFSGAQWPHSKVGSFKYGDNGALFQSVSSGMLQSCCTLGTFKYIHPFWAYWYLNSWLFFIVPLFETLGAFMSRFLTFLVSIICNFRGVAEEVEGVMGMFDVGKGVLDVVRPSNWYFFPSCSTSNICVFFLLFFFLSEIIFRKRLNRSY